MSDNTNLGDELSLDELENIVGGYTREPQLVKIACTFCGNICSADVQKPSFKCPSCKRTNLISG